MNTLKQNQNTLTPVMANSSTIKMAGLQPGIHMAGYDMILSALKIREDGLKHELAQVSTIRAQVESLNPSQRKRTVKLVHSKFKGERPKITKATLDVILGATKPLKTQEILDKVIKSGAQFTTDEPLDGIRAVLYRLKKEKKIDNPSQSLWAAPAAA